MPFSKGAMGMVHPSPVLVVPEADTDISKIDDDGSIERVAPAQAAKVAAKARLAKPEAARGSTHSLGTHPVRREFAKRRCSVEESCKGEVENMGSAKLCLPTIRNTLLSTLLGSCFIFVGLISLSGAELGVPGIGKPTEVSLLLRCLGWGFLFYIPVHMVAMPLLRNYVIWSVQPGDSLTREHSYISSEERPFCWRRATLLPYVLHACWITAYVVIICMHLGDEGYLGMLPIYGLGNLLMMPLGVSLCMLLAPPTVSKSYAFKVGPATILFPILGFLTVVTTYIFLRRLSGPLLGIAFPLVLSAYELLGTSLVCRIFLREFVTCKETREGYAGTNQGIVVSMAICNLHAMAEGARLTCFYVESTGGQDVGALLVPILSGVAWNVLARVGGLDRILHIISCGWRKPNNGAKLLREAGYCMGYPRFGAVVALLLARLCIGTPITFDDSEMALLICVLLAEMVEDALSLGLWCMGVNLFPFKQYLTEQEVEEMATSKLRKSQRVASKESSGRKGSKESSGRKGSKESAAASKESAVGSKESAVVPCPDEDPPVLDREKMKSTCWTTRVAYDFRFRTEPFQFLPFWAHLLPVAMAQFHTIFAMMVFANGLDYILGLCSHSEGDFQSAVVWWPVLSVDQLCT